MPAAYTVTITGSGASNPWMPDLSARTPFNIGIGVTVNSTNTLYNVEHTFDPIFQGIFPSTIAVLGSSQATWFSNTGITAQSSNANGNYAFPVVGIRLNVNGTGLSSVGTTKMTLLQVGP
jgi:hypothetical protein